MTISTNKQVTISNITFSCGQFIENPSQYMELVAPLFRASSFIAKPNESEDHRLTRLFYQLYYKKGYAADHDAQSVRTPRIRRSSNRAQQANEDISNEFAILEKLGINVVKHCAKTSKIVFKNSGNDYKIKNDNLDSLIQALKADKQYNRGEHEVKFGVELEFVADYHLDTVSRFNKAMRDLVGNERYDVELRYRHNDGSRWELGRDGSVRGSGKYGYELTSPIFTYGNAEHLAELEAVINLVKTILHGEVNKTCGTHVHMSFNCGKTSDDLSRHFAKCYGNSEDSLFDRLVPKYRNHRQWCRATNEFTIRERYHKLNLTTVKRDCESMHIEFRQLDGTLDFNKIMSWINVQKLFIDVTMQNAESKNVEKLELADIICNKDFAKDTETLMTMSKLAA